jgi:hypothetical protein
VKVWSFLGVVTALATVHLALVLPNHPAAIRSDALLFIPLEAPALVAGLAILGRAGVVSWGVRALLVAGLFALTLLKLGDYGTAVAYSRPFTLAVDHHLIPAAWNLMRDSVGFGMAALWALLAAIAFCAAIAGLWWALGRLAALGPPRRMRAPLAAFAALATVLVVADVGHALGNWRLPVRPPAVAAFTARIGVEHVARNTYTLGELAAFRRAASEDPFAQASGLFDALQGRDLIIVYVESYGRSSFENPLYVLTHPWTLVEVQGRLDAAGLASRSGWLTAPMVGGQSWLAHASVASGLWISDQGRYRAMLASPRRTLHHFAQDAGLRTVAVKPAHVFDWPEGDYFGFDAIYNATDLGYAGRPFNWATMPDQFTLKAFDRLERLRAGRPPLLAQIALVSSHAPFLPVPPVIDWEAIGDGLVFNTWADDGDPPEVVWRDRDRVREKFRLAIDYSLRAVGAYAERLADGSALLIVLGDHEPAPFISGVEGFDVPVHVIGPADLVERFAPLEWRSGMIPDPETPALRMDAMRDVLLHTLSGASS